MKQSVRPLKIGDILEVRTPRGFAYVQYTHYKKPYGTLIRVLPGFYPSRPTDFSHIAERKELYYVFCPVATLVQQGLLEVVTHAEVPLEARLFPAMRKRGGVDPVTRGGGVLNWLILEGEDESRVQKLTPAQARMSIMSSWSLGMLVKRLIEDWRPEMDIGLPDIGPDAQDNERATKSVRHFLYFRTEADAWEMRRRLSSMPWKIEIRRSAKGENWLVQISDPRTSERSLSKARSKLENLAVELHGEYDGWEIDVG